MCEETNCNRWSTERLPTNNMENLNNMRHTVPQYLDERKYSPQPHDPCRGYRQLHVKFLREHGIDGFGCFSKQRCINLNLNDVGRKYALAGAHPSSKQTSKTCLLRGRAVTSDQWQTSALEPKQGEPSMACQWIKMDKMLPLFYWMSGTILRYTWRSETTWSLSGPCAIWSWGSSGKPPAASFLISTNVGTRGLFPNLAYSPSNAHTLLSVR